MQTGGEIVNLAAGSLKGTSVANKGLLTLPSWVRHYHRCKHLVRL